jgi:hypothetical protein
MAAFRLQRPVFTAEQAALFMAFCWEMPSAADIEWESVDIDVINGKRVLCLLWHPEGSGGIYCHYCPEGCTEAELETLTRRHGMDGMADLEGWSRRLE